MVPDASGNLIQLWASLRQF